MHCVGCAPASAGRSEEVNPNGRKKSCKSTPEAPVCFCQVCVCVCEAHTTIRGTFLFSLAAVSPAAGSFHSARWKHFSCSGQQTGKKMSVHFKGNFHWIPFGHSNNRGIKLQGLFFFLISIVTDKMLGKNPEGFLYKDLSLTLLSPPPFFVSCVCVQAHIVVTEGELSTHTRTCIERILSQQMYNLPNMYRTSFSGRFYLLLLPSSRCSYFKDNILCSHTSQSVTCHHCHLHVPDWIREHHPDQLTAADDIQTLLSILPSDNGQLRKKKRSRAIRNKWCSPLSY